MNYAVLAFIQADVLTTLALPASSCGSKVVVQGLDGYIVAEKNGQLLVCSLKKEQRIKEFGTS